MTLGEEISSFSKMITDHLQEDMSPRTAVMLLSLIGLTASLADFFTCGDIFNNKDKDCKCSMVEENSRCMKTFLLRVYQAANIVLFVGCVVECSYMLQLYIWYTLSFIVFGFIVTIFEFLHTVQNEPCWSFLTFVTDIMYLFVIFWCLPLIDSYRKSMAPCPGLKIVSSRNEAV